MPREQLPEFRKGAVLEAEQLRRMVEQIIRNEHRNVRGSGDINVGAHAGGSVVDADLDPPMRRGGGGGTSVFLFRYVADIDDSSITGALQEFLDADTYSDVLDGQSNPVTATIRRPEGWPVVHHDTTQLIPAIAWGTIGNPAETAYVMIDEPLPPKPTVDQYKVLQFDSNGTVHWDYPRAHP